VFGYARPGQAIEVVGVRVELREVGAELGACLEDMDV
jgi:hypothetical protein